MKHLISVILLIIKTAGFGQKTVNDTIEQFKREISRLEVEIQSKTDSVNYFKNKITELENKELISNFINEDSELSIIAICKATGTIRKSNSAFSDILTTVNKNDKIKLLAYKLGYWFVNKEQFLGYLSELYIQETDEVIAFRNELQRIEKENKALLELQSQEENRQIIINKYGKEIGEKLLKGLYWIGMTEEMATVSLGRPRNINRSVGSWGIHKQWIYPNGLYLYFEDGILTSWQD